MSRSQGPTLSSCLMCLLGLLSLPGATPLVTGGGRPGPEITAPPPPPSAGALADRSPACLPHAWACPALPRVNSAFVQTQLGDGHGELGSEGPFRPLCCSGLGIGVGTRTHVSGGHSRQCDSARSRPWPPVRATRLSGDGWGPLPLPHHRPGPVSELLPGATLRHRRVFQKHRGPVRQKRPPSSLLGWTEPGQGPGCAARSHLTSA